ncbi:hypothetical protein WDW37_19820 [Bdellovibrionota bacterium FG-1]
MILDSSFPANSVILAQGAAISNLRIHELTNIISQDNKTLYERSSEHGWGTEISIWMREGSYLSGGKNEFNVTQNKKMHFFADLYEGIKSIFNSDINAESNAFDPPLLDLAPGLKVQLPDCPRKMVQDFKNGPWINTQPLLQLKFKGYEKLRSLRDVGSLLSCEN